MIYEVIVSDEANDELVNAIAFYNARSQGLGERFYSEFLSITGQLELYPSTHRLRYKDARFANFRRYPYATHYRIDEESKTVEVIGIISRHQDPGTSWKWEDES